MKRMRWTAAALLALTAGLLAGCTLDAGIDVSDSAEGTSAALIGTLGAVGTEAAGAPTVTATPEPTATDEPTPTARATERPTAPATERAASSGGSSGRTSGGASSGGTTRPTVTPYPTATDEPEPPRITYFDVDPDHIVGAGDIIHVTWEAWDTDDAELCINQLAVGRDLTECFEVPLAGSYDLTVGDGDGAVYVRLVLNPGSAEPVTEYAEIPFDCQVAWAFEPEAQWCPSGPAVTGPAAAQYFERGTMLYLVENGLYLIIAGQPPNGGSATGAPVYWLYDPLTITGDTEAEVTAPEGLYAPISGFGLVWRGDVERGGYQDILGWGTGAEFDYTATFQCDVSTSRWRFCYVTVPGGRTLVLHPNGYAYFK